MSDHDDILGLALDWIEEGHSLAQATVVETWGSSPRPVGSQLLINDRGNFVGSVSGGCVETFIVSEAIDVIDDGGVLNLEYGVTNEQAAEVRMACGGTIKVFVEGAPERDVLERLHEEQPIARVVDMESGQSAILSASGLEEGLSLDDQVQADARLLLKHGTSGVVKDGERKLFVKVYAKPRKLVIVGAVHIAQMLAPMAAAVGFRVTVLDPRPKFATPERLPNVNILTDPIKQSVAELKLDNWTAVALLAHDPMLDDPMLIAALESDVFYIGCLGSRKTQGARHERMRDRGFGDDDLVRLYGPIGLDIGGMSPGEIATSILAEIIAVGNDKR